MAAKAKYRNAGRWPHPGQLRLFFAFFFLVTVFCYAPFQHCQAATEQQLKIVYIYKFLSFISLPGDITDSYTVALLGPDSFGDEIEVLTTKKVRGKPINIERFSFLGESSRCQVLFVSPSMSKKLPHILEEAKKHRMLTISDMDGFVNRGGMIGFVVKEGRVRFEVNLKAARENDIKINSNLLEIASKVIR